jgi:hypothetical protein
LRKSKPAIFTSPEGYSGPVPISKEIRWDLMDLLKFVFLVFHSFYMELPTASLARDIRPGTAKDGLDNEKTYYETVICIFVFTSLTSCTVDKRTSTLVQLSYCEALSFSHNCTCNICLVSSICSHFVFVCH